MSAATGQPVWRCSYDVDDPRAQVFRRIGDGTIAQGMAFADAWRETMWRYADHVKQPGKAHNLSANAIRLVDVLLRRFTDWQTGRCDPSIEAIMERTRYARPTVIRLLAVARQLGFVDWVRRTERTGQAPGYGPQVKQTSNAYFFEPSRLPREARAELHQRLSRRSIPLTEHPERKGSAPLPPFWERQTIKKISAAARKLGARMGATRYRPPPAEVVRARQDAAQIDMDLLENQPRERWPELTHPNDPAAQAELRAIMGLPPLGDSASSDTCLQSPP